MPNKTALDEPKPKLMTDEEGWSVVAPRRNRGKRSGQTNPASDHINTSAENMQFSQEET